MLLSFMTGKRASIKGRGGRLRTQAMRPDVGRRYYQKASDVVCITFYDPSLWAL